ncbi:helix-turn-helix domain-containing protein [Anaerovibrio slackiae]|uniref:helix-turn-helix domain-containing protein n=1 Tax=Anaerovibrio slackiae TaxID=2652309 RepID=UPI00386642AE|nr:helix-turn-helix transcriptional regulator [Selenomonadaceae bacterium]MBQ5651896.1 helix-turn-helix transcriptional regulator [Selenomonadaceae bacterium]MBQ5732446.1 helix-turn-helix transcriptional regulator [Selenomonadaceae bacterium]MBQ5920592.1 helix-turn-helix transcriptional regulator [Selenomonadaceae bacterium]
MTQFRNLRIRKGLNQEEFRKLYNEKYNRNYTSAAISMIEHGKRMPELGALIDFADFYDVSLDYLLGRDAGSSGDQQLSAQLRAIVDRLMVLKSQAGEDDDSPEIRENMEMLRCLLQQSEVLAKRVEKEKDNSWYKY